MRAFSILPPEQMIDASLTLPLSKSIANRALIMSASASLPLPGPGEAPSDDVAVMAEALGRPPKGTVDIGPAGTAMRFLTAYFAALPGAEVTLTGSERMLHRPIGPLVDALRALGARIEYAGEEGFPPLRITGGKLHGGEIDIDASLSSQFISALLMVAPGFGSPLKVRLKGRAVSVPYIDLTLAMMRNRGIAAGREGMEVNVAPGSYRAPAADDSEGDWSAASYWYGIAALSAGFVALRGLREGSRQPDARVAEIFSRLGVVTEFTDLDDEDRYIGPTAQLSASPEVFSRLDLDMGGMPDLVPAVAVTACLLGVPFRLDGVANLRIKETDRIAALIAELGKLTFRLYADGDDTLVWDGDRRPVASLEPVETYGDHRMAMAFAPAAIYFPGLTVLDPEVVTKSYPGFWDDLRAAGFELREPQENGATGDSPESAAPHDTGAEAGSRESSGPAETTDAGQDAKR